MSYQERFVFSPQSASALIYDEHLVRYRLAATLAKDKRVLDLACGSGYGSELLAQAGASSVLAVDLDPAVIAAASIRYPRPNLSFVVDNAETLATIADDSIDLVVSFETIEHLPDYQAYLAALVRVLAPTGLALISTPNKAVFGQKNPFHVREFTRSEFNSELAAHFKHVKILDQVNGLSSVICASAEILSELSTAGETQYFVALCSNDTLPTDLTGQGSVNPAALLRWQNNPGWKLVNMLYKLLVSIKLIKN